MSQAVLTYAGQNLRLTMRKSAYVTFIIAMPLVMFLLFQQIFGRDPGDATTGATIMVNMALYGALGAAQNSGASLQMERRNGWFRQLAVAGLSGRGFLIGKAFSAVVLMIPAVLVVFVAGALSGVHLSVRTWVLSGLTTWLATMPMILVGLLVALWASAEAAQPANTVVMMVLAILGGLWFPADMFPHFLLVIARLTPTYWVRDLSTWPLAGGAFPWHGLVVLAAWTLLMAGLCVPGFRHAARASRR